ncbi:unnamed protein product [Vitrella brassicaformis CCMP3155]|uniref:J domain-containing protein n=3 Tax=Vitrella brassicaformis TaxID=1169539 RepID=A0A0G4FZT5_VITBC|nr:unnamed protein product [Vitrella brassicaformis CCMP3155]|eukprot:CEM20906.1 unnamed protein product [Vitrella brassicaformis CCMP3155]
MTSSPMAASPPAEEQQQRTSSSNDSPQNGSRDQPLHLQVAATHRKAMVIIRSLRRQFPKQSYRSLLKVIKSQYKKKREKDLLPSDLLLALILYQNGGNKNMAVTMTETLIEGRDPEQALQDFLSKLDQQEGNTEVKMEDIDVDKEEEGPGRPSGSSSSSVGVKREAPDDQRPGKRSRFITIDLLSDDEEIREPSRGISPPQEQAEPDGGRVKMEVDEGAGANVGMGAGVGGPRDDGEVRALREKLEKRERQLQRLMQSLVHLAKTDDPYAALQLTDPIDDRAAFEGHLEDIGLFTFDLSGLPDQQVASQLQQKKTESVATVMQHIGAVRDVLDRPNGTLREMLSLAPEAPDSVLLFAYKGRVEALEGAKGCVRGAAEARAAFDKAKQKYDDDKMAEQAARDKKGQEDQERDEAQRLAEEARIAEQDHFLREVMAWLNRLPDAQENPFFCFGFAPSDKKLSTTSLDKNARKLKFKLHPDKYSTPESKTLADKAFKQVGLHEDSAKAKLNNSNIDLASYDWKRWGHPNGSRYGPIPAGIPFSYISPPNYESAKAKQQDAYAAPPPPPPPPGYHNHHQYHQQQQRQQQQQQQYNDLHVPQPAVLQIRHIDCSLTMVTVRLPDLSMMWHKKLEVLLTIRVAGPYPKGREPPLDEIRGEVVFQQHEYFLTEDRYRDRPVLDIELRNLPPYLDKAAFKGVYYFFTVLGPRWPQPEQGRRTRLIDCDELVECVTTDRLTKTKLQSMDLGALVGLMRRYQPQYSATTKKQAVSDLSGLLFG